MAELVEWLAPLVGFRLAIAIATLVSIAIAVAALWVPFALLEWRARRRR